MTQDDFFSGTTDISTRRIEGADAPAALTNELIVKPTLPFPRGAVGPLVVMNYKIWQAPSGTGLVLLFYDSTTLPVDGSPWWGNADPKQDVLWVAPIQPGGLFAFNVAGPGDRYWSACAMILSANQNPASLARASASALFAVTYMSYAV